MTGPSKISIALHTALLLLFLGLPLVFLSGLGFPTDWGTFFSQKHYWIFIGIFLFIFYFHTYFLVPRLLFRQHYLLYGVLLLVMLIGIILYKPFDQLLQPVMPPMFQAEPTGEGFPELPARVKGMPKPQENKFDIFSVFLFFVIILVGVALMQIERIKQARLDAEKSESERIRAELSSLKAQIHPHFLFNTLNNIYSLAVSQSAHTPDAIMRLSNIMRYHTDEVQQELVELEQELRCIRDYISLQELRLGSKTTLVFEVEGDTGSLKIAPLLLLPFIENVFKYGISSHEPSSLNIKIRIQGSQLDLITENRKFQSSTQPEREGIGIRNTTERLRHLYPDRHQLNFLETNTHYSLYLTIQL
ncbi:MAG: histidine kinase [Chitinophagaceae bacterium]|nr:histidine kinase [Chitinophagaceae bacterium]